MLKRNIIYEPLYYHLMCKLLLDLRNNLLNYKHQLYSTLKVKLLTPKGISKMHSEQACTIYQMIIKFMKGHLVKGQRM